MINEVNLRWKNAKKEDIFKMEIVRISTAGSVDDGKSTLIGRLLYDNNALTKEQEALVFQKTKEKGLTDLDLSVITDGLIAEREQGITIDVAHIYFSTETRKFIISDSPGHIEYTRNMVTGASNSETSIILIDARKGLTEQSYRHFFISQLLQLDRVVFCVNKMDLVDYSEDRFLELAIEIKKMIQSLNKDITYSIVPVSSLKGDNVVKKSTNTLWYKGETLDELLHAPSSKKSDEAPFRFDVQNVIHSQTAEFVDYRAYAGRVVSGSISVGDKIITLPSRRESTITEIRRYTDTLSTAHAGDSIAISLADDIDSSRGTLLSDIQSIPVETNEIDATIVWMDEKPATVGSKLLIKVGAREFPVKLQGIQNVVNPINPSEKTEASSLAINDIAEVNIKLSQAGYFDSYSVNKKNGLFILIDPLSNNTVAVGFVK